MHRADSSTCGPHRAAADFAQALEYAERTLARTDIVHAGDHARCDHCASLQRPAASRAFRQCERESSERSVTQRGYAAPDELIVDERLRCYLVEVAPVAHSGADDDAPIVAEVGDDRARLT